MTSEVMLADSNLYMLVQPVDRRNRSKEDNPCRSRVGQRQLLPDTVNQDGEKQSTLRTDRSFPGGRDISGPRSRTSFQQQREPTMNKWAFDIQKSKSTIPRTVHVGTCGTGISSEIAISSSHNSRIDLYTYDKRTLRYNCKTLFCVVLFG